MATPQMSGAEAIKAARQYGYDGVDLRVSEAMGELTAESTFEEIRELVRVFDSEGIAPAGLLCYDDPRADEPDSWNRLTEFIRRHLEVAAVLGSPSIRIFGGDPHATGNPWDYISRMADAVLQALCKSEDTVSVLIQNHEDGYSVQDALKLAAQINNDRFGLIFSPDHCTLMSETLSELYAPAKPVTRQIYYADLLMRDGQEQSVLPGKGDVPLKEVFTAFGGGKYDGWITFKWEKIWHPELEPAEIALPYFVDYMKK
ncbi:MAG: sugar phosphate isomerase/epimerase [Firmicutes bacterium]|nr:sugar phosphate isomerase/epimerase [Bacillota bacterium]